MNYLLYYAGMAQDGFTEQIGLATSEDGNSFTRVGSGLILPVDPNVPWKSLRTCNPTVLQEQERFFMFYQGISAERKVSIGVATSIDGIQWKSEALPSISVESCFESNANASLKLTGVIEPAVIKEDGIYRMWFIGRGEKHPGNLLFHATSLDGLSWIVGGKILIDGAIFGQGCKIHYPQITVIDGLYIIDLSVRRPNGFFSVFRCISGDGLKIEGWKELKFSNTRAAIWRRVINKLHIAPCSYSHGLAHSHVISDDSEERLYFHAYHLDRQRRTYMDVVSVDTRSPYLIRQVFGRSADQSNWDSWFVADPFVLKVR